MARSQLLSSGNYAYGDWSIKRVKEGNSDWVATRFNPFERIVKPRKKLIMAAIDEFEERHAEETSKEQEAPIEKEPVEVTVDPDHPLLRTVRNKQADAIMGALDYLVKLSASGNLPDFDMATYHALKQYSDHVREDGL